MRGLYDCIKEDKMSEEEIIQTLENRLKSWNNIKEDCKNSELSNVIDQIEKDNQATQGLLDLYNKQKEENNKNYYEWRHLEAEVSNNYISKDKIRDKIKELKECRMRAISDIGLQIFNGEITMLEQLLEE